MGAKGSSRCNGADTESHATSDSSISDSGSEEEEEEDAQAREAADLRAWKVERKGISSWFCGGCNLEDACSAVDFQGPHSLRVRQVPLSTDHNKALFPDNSLYNIDDYFKVQWKSEVGQGGYAAVYVGIHKATKEELAVKVIQKSMIANPSRLQLEIEFAMRLDHPNIAKLVQTFEDRRYVYVVIELCKGGELFELVQAQTHLSERHAAIIMQQIFRAVFYMHTEGICHRDLKPENFLFLLKGPVEGNTLKVIDFGISASFKKKSDTFRTRTGTPYYVAPEVLEHPRYGPQCDLWSCGVVMFVLLSGRLPFRGTHDASTFAKVKKGKVSFTGESWTVVSKDAQSLILQLLCKNPAERMTAEQALQDSWVKEHAPSAQPAPLHTSVVHNLREFRDLSRFKKAALHAVARQMADNEIKQLRNIFLELDQDGNGSLSTAELIEGLSRANISQLSNENLQELVQGLDVDGSGMIDYTEFLAATLDRQQYDSERLCWNAFRVFDRNGDGSITRDELAEVLKSFDPTDMSEEAMNKVMREVDTNGDGAIDFEEFLVMMRSAADQEPTQ